MGMGTLVMYLGASDPADVRDPIKMYEYTFPLGAWVEIDEYRYPMTGHKLRRHRQFAVLDWSGPLETLEPLSADQDDG